MSNKDSSGNFFAFIFFLLPILALGTSVVHDASNDRIGWLIVDLVVFPLGVLRGFYLWLF